MGKAEEKAVGPHCLVAVLRTAAVHKDDCGTDLSFGHTEGARQTMLPIDHLEIALRECCRGCRHYDGEEEEEEKGDATTHISEVYDAVKVFTAIRRTVTSSSSSVKSS